MLAFLSIYLICPQVGPACERLASPSAYHILCGMWDAAPSANQGDHRARFGTPILGALVTIQVLPGCVPKCAQRKPGQFKKF